MDGEFKLDCLQHSLGIISHKLLNYKLYTPYNKISNTYIRSMTLRVAIDRYSEGLLYASF